MPFYIIVVSKIRSRTFKALGHVRDRGSADPQFGGDAVGFPVSCSYGKLHKVKYQNSVTEPFEVRPVLNANMSGSGEDKQSTLFREAGAMTYATSLKTVEVDSQTVDSNHALTHNH